MDTQPTLQWNPNAHKGTQQERRNRYMNREVKRQLGSSYSYENELYYIGNPMSDPWQTLMEKQVIARIERNWEEAIRA